MADDTLHVNVQWVENKRFEATARGNRVTVDQIYEDGREGMGFRPTELLLAALGACTMGNVLLFCQNTGIPVEDFRVELAGERKDGPTRIGKIEITLNLSGEIPEDRVESIRRVAERCRIHSTLKRAPEIDLRIRVAEKTP